MAIKIEEQEEGDGTVEDETVPSGIAQHVQKLAREVREFAELVENSDKATVGAIVKRGKSLLKTLGFPI